MARGSNPKATDDVQQQSAAENGGSVATMERPAEAETTAPTSHSSFFEEFSPENQRAGQAVAYWFKEDTGKLAGRFGVPR